MYLKKLRKGLIELTDTNRVLTAKERLYIALDDTIEWDWKTFTNIVDLLGPHVGGFKIGNEIAEVLGAPTLKEYLLNNGYDCFRDGKPYDIMTTDAYSVRAYALKKPRCINIHGLNGVDKMIEANKFKGDSLLYGVTILTDTSEKLCMAAFGATKAEKALQFANWSYEAGLDGLISSAEQQVQFNEFPHLKAMRKIIPGTRSPGAKKNEQLSLATPYDAVLEAGDSEIIIICGREILAADDPIAQTEYVISQIQRAMDDNQKGNDLVIIGKTFDEILELQWQDIPRLLTAEESLYIYDLCDAYWRYDYDAANEGRPGYCALLKSGNYSDGFFASQEVRKHRNLLEIFSRQMFMRLKRKGILNPTYVVGLPDSATDLGNEIRSLYPNAKSFPIEKDGKGFKITGPIDPNEEILFVEDVATKWTGFENAVQAALLVQPEAKFSMVNPNMLCRGGIPIKKIEGAGQFESVSVVTDEIKDWDPNNCPLVNDFGAEAIPPKKENNWDKLKHGQDKPAE